MAECVNSELPKQDCTSPSPTETVCLDSLCAENHPGTSQSKINQVISLDEEDDYDIEVVERIEKSNFLNELGLIQECEDDDEDIKEEYWEDCIDQDFSQDLVENFDEASSSEEISFSASLTATPRSSQLKRNNSDSVERILRKRKLDVNNGFPCKKIPTESPTMSTNESNTSNSSTYSSTASSPSLCGATTPGGRPRAVIPTKDNPPPEMAEWLTRFVAWSNAERIMAVNELIACCEPTQVRHMMQVIEPQFQRDFISLLPKELALNVLAFLEPKDLLRAAQTCRSWRFLAEDNLLWKEKCRRAGIEGAPRKRGSARSPGLHMSPWKAAYMRQHAIEMNWRSKPIRPPKVLKGHDDHVITCLQFCGNRIVSGSDDNTLKVWSATTGKCLRTLVGHTGGVWSSQMSGSTIISGSTDRTLKVWDADTGVCIHTLYGHTSTVRCMHLHGKKVVSGSRDATLRVWDIETGNFLHVLVGHLAAVRCVQYDGRLVVSGAYDYMVKVWNPETEECLHTLQGHTNRVYSLQFDGVYVVSGSLDTSIRVWEVETGACKHTLMGHQSLTSGMELRNNILVSGNADSTVKVWDIVTGQCLQTLSGPYKHQSAVTCLQFNGRFVITSSDDGTVKLWDVKTGEFVRNLVALDSGGAGGVVWRIRANDTKLEQEMEKQKLLFNQARLANRGVAEMVLLHISACKGVSSEMVMKTLELGISVLRGGNNDIQMGMLNHLKEKKDVGFFTSIAGLMNSCGSLDLDAFERNTKAEGLGVGSEGAAGEKNMHDAEFTCALFRFIQLTCEGHNLEWQNYLRTQAGNTTTVNVVICTVDYLLRLQESIMDFYWHYSSKELIDPAGKANFFKAIEVASQVFNTLTEVIQGPCTLNQQALAHSRLWDAVGGFLFLFSHMQDKLSKHSSQVDLLKELLNLQKDMITMMLSMLEGNVVNGTIGKQMVDTLVESASNVELILKYFDMFLKLKELTSTSSFQEIDLNNDGWVYPKDFKEKMEQQKSYTPEEIEFLLACCETNHDGKLDYIGFIDRFHEPAKEIGFNLAVLLTNLSEHMPNEPRLARFLETAGSVLNYFEPFLGRIEIMGGSKRIERVYFGIKESNIEQWEKPQIKESKRAFFYSIVTEGGDKEKLEAFINFCEDAIFEMQHASGLMAVEEAGGGGPTRATSYSYMTDEDEDRAAKNPVQRMYHAVRDAVWYALSCLGPSHIKHKFAEMQQMTFAELVGGFCRSVFYVFYYSGFGVGVVVKYVLDVLMSLMRGPVVEEPEVQVVQEEKVGPMRVLPSLPSTEEQSTQMQAFGVDITKEDNGQYKMAAHESPAGSAPSSGDGETTPEEVGEHGEADAPETPLSLSDLLGGEQAKRAQQEKAEAQAAQQAAMQAIESESKQVHATEPSAMSQINFAAYGKRTVSFLARNFYNLKYVALVLAFCINFMLLFYKVSSLTDELGSGTKGMPDILEASGSGGRSGSGSGEDDDADDAGPELVHVDEDFYYMAHVMRLAAALHSIVSLAMLIAYYHLKVPLAIFKREKEIARRLEFEGLYIAEQPEDDDLKSHWDKMVISAKSFPVNYWDKFVKKKVRQKYSETYDFESISNLLGMEKTSFQQQESDEKKNIISMIINIDWRYQIWKSGVTITDNSFLYSLWYFTFSILGNFNNFFFAAHLLDVAVGFKTLRTILQSVTHNGKQLVLTVMLLIIIVYIYTVIAFNFFRKFYVQEEDEEVDRKCHDMLTCFVFHLYKGVRAGGGIGDEIEPPDGDEYEVYRIMFDITFFFFIIIILLAIIQGLIIDAFGELRDQLESVKEDMESNCFICGIGKDYFDKVPHGFDTHVQQEHNLANYLFFLMHLINKPDTEYTGQETYVWNMYQQRCWDFFPVGDCFRKQYEDELGGGGG